LQALGFNAFKLAPSNFKEWRTDVDQVSDLFEQMDYHVDSTKPDSEAGSMVYELLLKLALPITTPIQCHDVGSAKIYMAKPDSGKHVAMFFEPLTGDVLAFILKAKPVKVLCLNKCFVDSQALTNFSLQLQDADVALEVL
jgi:adenine-specific DNA-methyltransferase